MNLVSTRDPSATTTLSGAIARGLSADGGLFVPADWPVFESRDFSSVETLPEIGHILLSPFFVGDPLANHLADICEDAFDFPIPLRPLPEKRNAAVLELFHGPTAAFKDVGARFLAACIQRMEHDSGQPLTILVATSGDTGGAVAAAFHDRDGVEVVLLYPRGMVSPRQEKQLTCWGGNVDSLRVEGVFDDCQRLVKQAFAAPELAGRRLSSANSINIGRMLPQAVYYAAAALWHWRETGRKSSFIVPTGNLGNAVAAVWARHMGLPIENIVLATNANRVIPDFLHSGRWQPRQSIATLASAMDVGDPSNMERLRNLYSDNDHLSRQVSAWAVSDEQIERQIVADYRAHAELWCPHTATAMYVHDTHMNATDGSMNIVVATAHPAKFETVIEPLIDDTVAVPPALQKLLHLDSNYTPLPAEFDAFAQHLLSH